MKVVYFSVPVLNICPVKKYRTMSECSAWVPPTACGQHKEEIKTQNRGRGSENKNLLHAILILVINSDFLNIRDDFLGEDSQL